MNTTYKKFAVGVMMAVLLSGGLMFAPVAKAETNRDMLLAQISQLLELITALQKQVALMNDAEDTISSEGGFNEKEIEIGSRVKTTDMLKVRSGASTGASWINNMAPYSSGTVMDGPKYSDGYTWWLVQYDNGTRGWSVQNWFKVTGFDADWDEDEVVDKSTPSCEIKTNKSSYTHLDDIKVSWTSENANYLKFVVDTEKDGFNVPESDKLDTSGSLILEATVLGLPTIKLKAVGEDGEYDYCSTQVKVSERRGDFEALLNGSRIKYKDDVLKYEAQEMCKELYNDYGTYNFDYGDVLECLWNDAEFETVDQWKG